MQHTVDPVICTLSIAFSPRLVCLPSQYGVVDHKSKEAIPFIEQQKTREIHGISLGSRRPASLPGNANPHQKHEIRRCHDAGIKSAKWGRKNPDLIQYSRK